MKGSYKYFGLLVVVGVLAYFAVKDAAYCVVEAAADASANGYFGGVTGAYVQKGSNASRVPGLFETAAMLRPQSPVPFLRLTQKGWVLANAKAEVLYLNAPQQLDGFLTQPPSNGWLPVNGQPPAPVTRCGGSLSDVTESTPTTNIGAMINRPVSTALLLGMTIYAYRLWANRTPVEDVAISYDLVVNQGQLFRIFSASVAHFDLLHLGFNMMSLYNLAPLEDWHGSVSYACLSVGLIVLTQMLCMLAYHAIVLRTQMPELGQQLAVGYSCVLFAWMVDASVKMDKYCPIPFAGKFCFETFKIPTLGLSETPLPVNLGPFVLLVLIKIFIPRSSFLGHLSGIVLGYPLAWGLLDWLTPDVLFAACVLGYTQSERCWVWLLPGYSTRAPLHEFVEQRQLKIQRLLYVCFGFYVAASAAYALYFGTVPGLVRVMVAGYVFMCAEAKRCEWLTEDSSVKKDCGRLMMIAFVVLMLDGILQTLNLGAVLGAYAMINANVQASLPYPAMAGASIIAFAIMLDVCAAGVLVLNMVTIPATVTWLKELGFDPTATPTAAAQAATTAFSGRAHTLAAASTRASSTRPARPNLGSSKAAAPGAEDLQL